MKKNYFFATVLIFFALIFAFSTGCKHNSGGPDDPDDPEYKPPFVGPNDDNPGGGAVIPAVQPGGSNKYDLVLWEGYASNNNASAVDLIADNGPTYYRNGMFHPSWFQPGIVLDLECKSENGLVYLRLWDQEKIDYGEFYTDTASDWGNPSDGWDIDGFIHNLRISYARLRQPSGVAPANSWSGKYPDSFEKLARIQIINPNLVVVTKVTLRNVPLVSAPAGWNNPGITEIAGIKPELDGGNGTKANPYTAELEVPSSQINIGAGDIKANYPMFSAVAVYADGDFAEPPMKSAIFLPEAVPTPVYIKVTAGDGSERYFNISTTRKAGFVDNGNGTVTRTIYSGNFTAGTFNISKSGGEQFKSYPFNGNIHGTMDMEYIISGGYIEVEYSGNAPQLHLLSDQKRSAGLNDVTRSGSASSSGVRRFDSNDLLSAMETNFGYGTLGTRDPSVLAGIQITGAGSVKKITVVYNPNDPSLRTFSTVDEMKTAAIKFAGNPAKIKAAMTKAQSGQPVTVVFFGGSITQHGKPNNGLSYWRKNNNTEIWYSGGQQTAVRAFDTRGYAGRVAKWFVDTFPSSNITYVNSSYGGVGSGGGESWLDTFVGEGNTSANVGGLLAAQGGGTAGRLFEPDIVFLEFAVNDSMGGWGASGEYIDNIISKLADDSSDPGVMVLISFNFDDGHSADVSHTLAAQKNNVPVVSNRAALWPNIRVGLKTPYNRAELAYDGVHPNDKGHEVYADFIINRLMQIRNQ